MLFVVEVVLFDSFFFSTFFSITFCQLTCDCWMVGCYYEVKFQLNSCARFEPHDQGMVHEVFEKNFGREGFKGLWKSFWEGWPFWRFYFIFINKICKNIRGRVHFYPPSPPCVHLCIWLFQVIWTTTQKTEWLTKSDR